MSDAAAERVAALAAAARVPLAEGAAARIAGATAPTIARYAAENIALPLETEPASFLVVQLRDSARDAGR
jgi:hypothetical protein